MLSNRSSKTNPAKQPLIPSFVGLKKIDPKGFIDLMRFLNFLYETSEKSPVSKDQIFKNLIDYIKRPNRLTNENKNTPVRNHSKEFYRRFLELLRPMSDEDWEFIKQITILRKKKK